MDTLPLLSNFYAPALVLSAHLLWTRAERHDFLAPASVFHSWVLGLWDEKYQSVKFLLTSGWAHADRQIPVLSNRDLGLSFQEVAELPVQVIR